MKEKKRILSLLLSLLLITALLLTPAGAQGFDTELLSATQSTITAVSYTHLEEALAAASEEFYSSLVVTE